MSNPLVDLTQSAIRLSLDSKINCSNEAVGLGGGGVGVEAFGGVGVEAFGGVGVEAFGGVGVEVLSLED